MFKRVQQLKAVAIIYALIISSPILFATADYNDVATQIAPQIFNAVENLFFVPHGFEPGTLVKTPYGYSKIEELRVGDLVVAIDELGRQSQARVAANTAFFAPEFIAVFFNKDFVLTNRTQLFRTAGDLAWQDTTKFSPYTFLKNLANQDIQIRDVFCLKIPKKLICLALENCHNFCVTEQDIVVHNVVLEATAAAIGKVALDAAAACLSLAAAHLIKEYLKRPRRTSQRNFSAEQTETPRQTTTDKFFAANQSQIWEDPRFLRTKNASTTHQHAAADFIGQVVAVKFLQWFDRKSNQEKDTRSLLTKIGETALAILTPFFNFTGACAEGFATVMDGIVDFVHGIFSAKKTPPPQPQPPQFVEPLPGLRLWQHEVNAATDNHLDALERQANETSAPANATITPAETPQAGPIGCGDIAAADEAEQIGCALVPEQTPDLDGNTGCGSTETPSRPEHIGCARTPAKNPDLDRTPGCGTVEDFKLDDTVLAKSKQGDRPRNARPQKIQEQPHYGGRAPRARTIGELDRTPLGEKLRGKYKKVVGVIGKSGAPVFEITEDIPELELKKGDVFYIDREYDTEIEVFDGHKHKSSKQKLVISTNGEINRVKTTSAKGRDFIRGGGK